MNRVPKNLVLFFTEAFHSDSCYCFHGLLYYLLGQARATCSLQVKCCLQNNFNFCDIILLLISKKLPLMLYLPSHIVHLTSELTYFHYCETIPFHFGSRGNYKEFPVSHKFKYSILILSIQSWISSVTF